MTDLLLTYKVGFPDRLHGLASFSFRRAGRQTERGFRKSSRALPRSGFGPLPIRIFLPFIRPGWEPWCVLPVESLVRHE